METANSYITLSKSAYKNNIRFIREILGKKCEFVSVVKGNAYGHSIRTFVPMAYDCGVKNFAVFSVFEARELLETGVRPDRLIIMGEIPTPLLEWVIENEIDFFVFNFDRLRNAAKVAKKVRKPAKVHIEIETGMNRTGFVNRDLNKLFSFLKSNHEELQMEGLCTHLAGAEDISNYLRIKDQIKYFNRVKKRKAIKELGVNKIHVACSAATINYPQTILDLARVGIMQYGFWPSREVKMGYFARTETREDPLKRVISWKSTVMDTKSVKAGEYIGYGRSFLSETDMKIAVIPIGYANGFTRSLSNVGKVLVNGSRVDVIGTVNMNMLAVDISYVKKTKIGDEVILIGNEKGQSITVSSFSDLSDQLNYEMLTRLPHDIPRQVIR